MVGFSNPIRSIVCFLKILLIVSGKADQPESSIIHANLSALKKHLNKMHLKSASVFA